MNRRFLRERGQPAAGRLPRFETNAGLTTQKRQRGCRTPQGADIVSWKRMRKKRSAKPGTSVPRWKKKEQRREAAATRGAELPMLCFLHDGENSGWIENSR